MTVPILPPPPTNEFGENVSDLGTFATVVNDPVTVVPFALADNLIVVEALTTLVEIVKVALEAPASTLTDAGMDVTADAPLTTAKVTAVSTGAGPAIFTVPVVLNPPTIEVGLNERELGISGVTVRTAAAVALPDVAVIFAVVFVATAEVAMLTEALVLPEGTLTLAGTMATALALDRFAVIPLGPAMPTK